MDITDRFEISSWATEEYQATSMELLPDGRALVITKGGSSGAGTGQLKLLDHDGTFIRNILEVPVCSDFERGLLGIALDPNFESEPFVYLFFTRQMSDCALNDPPVSAGQEVWNRVARWRFDEFGMAYDAQEVLVDDLPAHQSSHNAGDLEFLPDGTLLVSVGEGTFSALGPISLDAPVGKILRIDPRRPDTPLSDNPWAESDGLVSWRDFVFASGFRNPYRIAVRASDGLVIAADVGTDEYEELNIVSSGNDYGFPASEGPGSPDGSLDPALFYHHRTGCGVIIGGDFVSASIVPLSDASDDVFIFTDFGCGKIWAAEIANDMFGNPRISSTWLLGDTDRWLTDITAGPDGSLYLVSIGAGPIERLVRSP